jgi:hypothetical protein
MKTLLLFITILFGISVYSQSYKDTSLNVRILRMDNYDSLKLQKHSKFIKEKFGYKVILPDNTIKSEDYLTISNSFIDVIKLLQNMYCYEITIVFTNNPLYESPISLKGATDYERKVIIIDGNLDDINLVIIHEIGHVLGIHHCENTDCIMFDNAVKEEFCNKCLSIFNR